MSAYHQKKKKKVIDIWITAIVARDDESRQENYIG